MNTGLLVRLPRISHKPIMWGRVSVTRPQGYRDLFIGDRSDGFANFEGRMTEVAIRGALYRVRFLSIQW